DPAPYEAYMKNLAMCDLAIGSFPFGGSNTNVDLLLLGIPKIIYNEGSDFASFTDYHIMRMLNIPSLMVTKSEGELLASAIYLIHNSLERERISKEILNQNPADILFYSLEEDKNKTFIENIHWIEKSTKNSSN